MENEQTIVAAIKKALTNGWWREDFGRKSQDMQHWVNKCIDIIFSYYQDDECGLWGVASLPVEQIIYSKDFAKAFWGEGAKVCNDCGLSTENKTNCEHYENARIFPWQYHLQQQVISDDPIKYLEKGL